MKTFFALLFFVAILYHCAPKNSLSKENRSKSGMTENNANIKIESAPTVVSFISSQEQPWIDHAHFDLVNKSERPISIKLSTLTFSPLNREISADSFYVYNRETDEAILERDFSIPENSTTPLRITFPRFLYFPKVDEMLTVRLTGILPDQNLVFGDTRIEVIEEW